MTLMTTTTSLLILMPYMLTPSAVTTYVFLCVLAVGGMLTVGVDLWRSRTTRAGRLALAVVGCVLGWLLAVICSLLSPTATLALFWHETVRFMFVVLLPPLIILYFACYFGVPRLSRRLVVGVSLIPGLTILLDLTNGLHHWFLADYTMQHVGPYFVRASWVPGPWFPIYAGFTSGSLLVVVVALALAYERRQPLYRAQMGVMSLALVLPSALILFDTVSRSMLALLGLAPLGFAATALLLALGLRYLRVLDLVPVAREAIFASMADPVLVLDARGRIIDLNPAAEQLLGRSAETVLGAEIKALLPGRLADLHDFHPHAPQTPQSEEQEHGVEERGAATVGELGPANTTLGIPATLDLELGHDGKGQTHRFDVRLSPFGLRAGRVDGHLLVLREVTALKQAEAHLAEQASELEAIFEAQADGVAVYDLQGRFVRANSALRHLLGFDADAAYTARPLDERAERLLLFDEHGQRLTVEQWPHWLVLRGEILTGASAMEGRVRTVDGRELWISTTGAPMRASDGQVTGTVLITRDVTARRALERQAAEQAAAAERTRLAHELHDTVTQDIYSAGLLVESITRNWPEHRADAEAALAQLPGVIRSALAGLRVLLLELRPTTLEQLPLSALLRQLAEAMSTRAKVPIAVTTGLNGSNGRERVSGEVATGDGAEGAEPPLPAAVKVVFYRVAQEALMNAAKYARARAISVQLRTRGQDWDQDTDRGRERDTDHGQDKGTIELEIADDGQGFDPRVIPAGHFGLEIMRERAHAVSATVQVHTQPGQGTRIVVAWHSGHSGHSEHSGRQATMLPEGGTA